MSQFIPSHLIYWPVGALVLDLALLAYGFRIARWRHRMLMTSRLLENIVAVFVGRVRRGNSLNQQDVVLVLAAVGNNFRWQLPEFSVLSIVLTDALARAISNTRSSAEQNVLASLKADIERSWPKSHLTDADWLLWWPDVVVLWKAAALSAFILAAAIGVPRFCALASSIGSGVLMFAAQTALKLERHVRLAHSTRLLVETKDLKHAIDRRVLSRAERQAGFRHS